MTVINFDREPKKIKNLLSDVAKYEYEDVMVIGVKNDEIYTHFSEYKDVVKIIGMLEMLKQDLLTDGKLYE